MSKAFPAPVSFSERSTILDVLRGFALLGVLLDNLFGFTGWDMHNREEMQAIATWPADGIFALLELVFINGKFYSLFSLLFGIGFSIILIRNEQKAVNPLPIFYRRLTTLLLVFGIPHLFFFWSGDILTVYALVGLLLPLFRKCSDRTLVTWSICLIASPVLIDAFKVLLHFKTGDYLESIAKAIDKQNGIPSEHGVGKYLFVHVGGWQHWRKWQDAGFFYRYAYLIESNRFPKVLGMFLLGYYAGRKMIYAHLEDHILLFKKLRFWGLWIGIPASLGSAYFEILDKSVPDPIGLFGTLCYALGVVPLSLAYTASLCLYWVRKKGQTKLKKLAPMGRMALTNYLMQTFLAITIYYGVGLGLGGNIGPTVFLPLGVCVYLLQVVYSNGWFMYFNYGPFEYLWRTITYGKKLNMTGKPEAS